jgi:hypothetical protein
MIATGMSFYNAAKQLPPFGKWKIVGYHYANGDLPGNNEPSDLINLVGSYAYFYHDGLRIGNSYCAQPSFTRTRLTSDEIARQLGPPEKALGVNAPSFDLLLLKCDSDKTFSPSMHVFSLSTRKTLMVWEGVLLELESPSPSRWSFLKDLVIQ